MSSHFTSIRQSAGGASAYAEYVAADVETVFVEDTEITGDSSLYASYTVGGAELSAGRWLGTQAAAWGLTGQGVTVETLTTVLSHRDPVTGADLDGGRVRRAEEWAARREAWERARARWAANPGLAERADAFDRVVQAAEAGDGTIDEVALAELGALLTEKQVDRLHTAVGDARRAGRSQVQAVRSTQAWMRLVPPAARMAEEAPAAPSREVIGYDLTLSTPKSVSVLLTDEAVRGRVVACQQRAVEEAVLLLERELTATRSGAGGLNRHATAGVVAAAIDHFTSRPAGDPPAADPQLHTHVVLSAMAQSAEGAWSSIDSRTWMRCKVLLDRFYGATLRAALTDELGVEWRQRETTTIVSGRPVHTWEVRLSDDPALDDALIETFSGRDAEMRAEVAAARAEGRKVTEATAWAATRRGKDEPALAACEAEWAERLAQYGLTPTVVGAGACDRATETVRRRAAQSRSADAAEVLRRIEDRLDDAPSDAEREELARNALGFIDRQAQRLAAERGTFTRVELVRAVADSLDDASLQGSLSGGELLGRVDAWLLRAGVIVHYGEAEIDPTAWTAARFSTSRHMRLEAEALEAVMRLSEPAGAAVSEETAAAVLAMYREARGGAKGALSTEQAQLFMEALRNDDGGRLTTCVAPAGAGKSYVAGAVAEAWRREHGIDAQVVTVALASAAGDALSQDLLGAKADLGGSIELLLWQLQQNQIELTPETLIVIDEAGMANTSKLGQVLAAADVAGARVLMFGDHMQIDSPGQAGGLLRYLAASGQAIELDDTMRARDEADRAAQIAWRSALDRGDEPTARATLDHFVERGGVHIADGEAAARDVAFEQWKELYEAAKGREAEWVARRDVLAAETGDRVGPSLRAAEAALAEHKANRAQIVDDDLLVMATTHEDVARLNDSIRDYLVERGDLSLAATVQGRRFRGAGRDDAEELRGADGTDLAATVFCKGMAVRVTTNTSDGALRQRAAELQAMLKATPGGDRERSATERMAANAERRAAAEELKQVREDLLAAKVLNGQRGVVESVHPDTGDLTMRVRDGAGGERLVRVTASQLQAGVVVPGMAVTAHAAQGVTASHTVLLADGDTSANLLYVGMSRAKGDARVVFQADLDRKDPRLVQWETDRRAAELRGEAFLRPAPSETIDGLWQLADAWCTAGGSMMATHLAATAGLTVTPADLAQARTILEAGGDHATDDAVQRHAEMLAERRARLVQQRAMATQAQGRDRGGEGRVLIL